MYPVSYSSLSQQVVSQSSLQCAPVWPSFLHYLVLLEKPRLHNATTVPPLIAVMAVGDGGMREAQESAEVFEFISVQVMNIGQDISVIINS